MTYGAVAVVLHWLLAVLIVAAFFVGLSMVGLPFSPLRLRLFNWHKWIGVAALALSAARLLWRLAGHPPPPMPQSCRPGSERRIVRPTCSSTRSSSLVPLLGWAYTSAAGVPVVFLGWLPLPDFVPRDKALADAVLKPLHQAALVPPRRRWSWSTSPRRLKHHYVERDGLLVRMWPWWPSRVRA